MRKPKFMPGDKVMVEVGLEHAAAQFFLTTKAQATVCFVGYDPKDGSGGWPWYRYSVLIKGANNQINVSEDKLEEAV